MFNLSKQLKEKFLLYMQIITFVYVLKRHNFNVLPRQQLERLYFLSSQNCYNILTQLIINLLHRNNYSFQFSVTTIAAFTVTLFSLYFCHFSVVTTCNCTMQKIEIS